jgi:hypothetical protein
MPITLYGGDGYIKIASAKPADRPRIQSRAEHGDRLTVCGGPWSPGTE